MKWHTLRTVAIVCDYNYLESYNISIQKLGDFLSIWESLDCYNVANVILALSF